MDNKGSIKTTRRGVLLGAGAGVGTAALGMAAAPALAAPAAIPETWDDAADVLVVGYGGAGAVAAVTAHDAGAKVMVLEKQASDGHTSNTQMCLGVFLSPDTVQGCIDYMSVASLVNVDMPESKDIDDDTIRVWAEESVRNRDWLTSMGVQEFEVFSATGRDPDWPGNDQIKAYQIKKPDGSVGIGKDLFEFLDGLVQDRGIDVRWDAPGKRLITDADGAVVGVQVTQGGKDLSIRARRAVVLTTGGFEFDMAARRTYLPASPMVFYGNPDNTGDGMRMAQGVGADLWHMTVLGGGFKYQFDGFPTAFAPSFGSGSYMVVDKFGERFKSEAELGGYSGYWNALVYDTVNYTWPRIPAWYVFDEKRRLAGPIVYTFFGAAGPIGMYDWSKDNSAEIEKGWIKRADTIEGLAAEMGVDPAVLAAQVQGFDDGEDADFGRAASSMAPLDAAPFYAVQLWPGLNNTFGGPRRNAKAQIIDTFGDPITGLYSAGELGSIFVQYPQGGANVGECLAFGRIAGANAAAQPVRGE
ncbi:FAD-dependent oxidoreductase [Tropicibacter oceani]|uniref:FAD-binding protein n=1 Tax=Tropicibacter oceani TaxID=3058420 RepID=A0ABY8QJF8_9RHOB|nr:FAD-binding protein [Tropicibacter oceani]WGW04113.1 FAD-binding protein [Tropicibacter oceani]